MKKVFKTLFVLMCGLVMTTSFLSCGSDDKDDNTNQPPTPEFKGIGAIYTISVTEQMAKLCDYTVTYYAKNNVLANEKMTWKIENGVATWEKEVSSIVMPATFGVKISLKIKDDAQLSGVTINNFNFEKTVLYMEGITTDEKMVWKKTYDFSNGLGKVGCTGEKLDSYIATIENKNNGTMLNQSYSIDKTGSIVSSGAIE